MRFIPYPHPRFYEHRYATQILIELSIRFRVAFVLLWLGKRGRAQRPKSGMFRALDSYHKNGPIMESTSGYMFVLRSHFSHGTPVGAFITYSRMLAKATISHKFFFSSFFFLPFRDDAMDFRAILRQRQVLGSVYVYKRRVRLISKLGAPDAMTTMMTTRLRYSARRAFMYARARSRVFCVCVCVCMYVYVWLIRMYALLQQKRSLGHSYGKERESRRVNK